MPGRAGEGPIISLDNPRLALCVPNVPRRPNNTNRLYTLGLLYLRDAAERVGWRCRTVDAYFRGLDVAGTARELLAQGVPDVVGLTLNSKAMCDVGIDTLRELALAGARPTVVVGGHYASAKGRTLLERHPELDYVVCGEGEETLAELLTELRHGGPERAIAGLVGRRGSSRGDVPRRPLIRDLDARSIDFAACDELPGPAEWSLCTSRGCSAACSYCPVGALWGKYRSWRGHSATWIADRMDELVHRHGATSIQFVDDEFVGTPESVARAWELVALLRERCLRVPFYIMTRADTVSAQPELVRALAGAGLHTAFVGVESANEDVLEWLRKDATVAQAERAVEILDGAGVRSAAGTIVFHPRMTRDSIRRDLGFLERMTSRFPGFFFFGLNELDILEGTPLGMSFEGGRFDWMHEWSASEPAVQTIYRCWLRVQTHVLFPAMRMTPPASDLALRRALGLWQIEAARSLVDVSSGADAIADYLTPLLHSMARLLVDHRGPLHASEFLLRRTDFLSGGQAVTELGERCFD